MTTSSVSLDFIELDAMDAPSDGFDWARGFTIGFIVGLQVLAYT